MEERIEPIYIRSLFKIKNPKLARWIPPFIYSFLERVIHQDEINHFIETYGDKKGVDFADSVIEYLNITFNIKGEENLPSPEGRYIFASNHPLGGPEGIILISILGKRYSVLKFPVNDLLLYLKNLNNIFLPVNKHGGQARDAAKAIDEAFASDAQIATFPAGMVSRKYNGEIRDPEWQKSFISKAVKHHRDIVPIHFIGKNSSLFYNIFKFRRLVGIKLNLEMMLLPRELFKKRGSAFTIKIGKTIPWETFDKSKTAKEWAAYVQDLVYQI